MQFFTALACLLLQVALYVEASMHDCTLLAESFTEV